MTEQKNYSIEFDEDEVEGIERAAAEQGVATPDFISYCVRCISFGYQYAINKLAETGHVGPWDKGPQ